MSLTGLGICPRCTSDVPLPHYQRGRGIVSMRCRVCHSLLQVGPLPPDSSETDSSEELARILDIPGYDLLGLLGKGGMGNVYSAVRHSDRELVAIKVLPSECLRYPELIQRFTFESQMMASLSHPGIVPVLDRGQSGQHPYLVMEYVPGCTLKSRIEKAGRLSLEEVLAVAIPTGEAIQRCHDAGLVHRDLKPGNVLLSQAGTVHVTDFGIANLIRRLGDQTGTGVTIGTPQYVAPEQVRDGSSVGVRADQYSLGVILFEMLTCQLPMGVYGPIRDERPDLPVDAEQAIMRALSRSESDRFDSVRQFVGALRRALRTAVGDMDERRLVRDAAFVDRFHSRGLTGAPHLVPIEVVKQGNAAPQGVELYETPSAHLFESESPVPVGAAVAPPPPPASDTQPKKNQRDTSEAIVTLEELAALATLDVDPPTGPIRIPVAEKSPTPRPPVPPPPPRRPPAPAADTRRARPPVIFSRQTSMVLGGMVIVALVIALLAC